MVSDVVPGKYSLFDRMLPAVIHFTNRSLPGDDDDDDNNNK